MRYKKMKLSAVLLLGLGMASVKAQTMYVNENSGTQNVYTLSNVQKMTFSGGNVNIQKTDNSITYFDLSDISYISFTDLITSIVEQMDLGKYTNITAYPNPISDVINIDLSSLKNRKGTLSLVSLDGGIILTRQTQGTEIETLNLSELINGVYYCQFANENEIKTVKIIKD